MNNALQQPQTVVVLGGGSDIARAIVVALDSSSLRTVVLGCRDVDSQMRWPRSRVERRIGDRTTLRRDRSRRHADWVAAVAAEHGDLDIVIQAFGQLGADAAETPLPQPSWSTSTSLARSALAWPSPINFAHRATASLVSLSSVAGCTDASVELRLRLDKGGPRCIHHRSRPCAARVRRSMC